MTDPTFDKTEWLRSRKSGFGVISTDDEFLHAPGTAAFSEAETWWFEAIEHGAGLIASFYITICPHLGVFNLSGCDDPAGGPAWGSAYSLGANKAFYDGWLMKYGELRRVVSMSKRTERLPAERMRSARIEAEFVDDHGERHQLVGRPRSSLWMHHWPDIMSWFGLTAWELDGVSGFGEAQDYAWTDFAKRFWR